MKLPRHVVIIPDGNRRWAHAKKRPSFFGHIKGAEQLEEVIRSVFERGIPYLTVWGSSVNNLTQRSEEEVRSLYDVYERFFSKLRDDPELKERSVRVIIIGRWRDMVPERVARVFDEVMEVSRNHEKFVLTFLIGYDGKEEMLSAIERMVASGGSFDGRSLKSHLWTSELPSVDLVIRTGGEPHWSAGLMMWDVAEARLYFTETLWPDFAAGDLDDALVFYDRSNVRNGA